MAKDVALRELDQAGFKISNLGTPSAAGDATKTDNAFVPKPSSGAGAPGTSFLAAPADHVHPAVPGGGGAAGPGTLVFDDPSYQTVTGNKEELVCEFPIDFSALGTPGFTLSLSAVVKSSEGPVNVAVRVGGEPGAVDGPLITSVTTDSTTFVKVSASDKIGNPGRTELLKITAIADRPTAVAHIYGKSVQLRSDPVS